eukprot:GILJ01014879.1.p1 GENE.GILJ01014879.1~~GILJ01014879.1.p1  ORF type:complete len:828 (+),score=126.21 GILJ01014879.1:2309-4792(+)
MWTQEGLLIGMGDFASLAHQCLFGSGEVSDNAQLLWRDYMLHSEMSAITDQLRQLREEHFTEHLANVRSLGFPLAPTASNQQSSYMKAALARHLSLSALLTKGAPTSASDGLANTIQYLLCANYSGILGILLLRRLCRGGTSAKLSAKHPSLPAPGKALASSSTSNGNLEADAQPAAQPTKSEGLDLGVGVSSIPPPPSPFGPILSYSLYEELTSNAADSPSPHNEGPDGTKSSLASTFTSVDQSKFLALFIRDTVIEPFRRDYNKECRLERELARSSLIPTRKGSSWRKLSDAKSPVSVTLETPKAVALPPTTLGDLLSVSPPLPSFAAPAKVRSPKDNTPFNPLTMSFDAAERSREPSFKGSFVAFAAGDADPKPSEHAPTPSHTSMVMEDVFNAEARRSAYKFSNDDSSSNSGDGSDTGEEDEEDDEVEAEVADIRRTSLSIRSGLIISESNVRKSLMSKRSTVQIPTPIAPSSPTIPHAGIHYTIVTPTQPPLQGAEDDEAPALDTARATPHAAEIRPPAVAEELALEEKPEEPTALSRWKKAIVAAKRLKIDASVLNDNADVTEATPTRAPRRIALLIAEADPVPTAPAPHSPMQNIFTGPGLSRFESDGGLLQRQATLARAATLTNGVSTPETSFAQPPSDTPSISPSPSQGPIHKTSTKASFGIKRTPADRTTRIQLEHLSSHPVAAEESISVVGVGEWSGMDQTRGSDEAEALPLQVQGIPEEPLDMFVDNSKGIPSASSTAMWKTSAEDQLMRDRMLRVLASTPSTAEQQPQIEVTEVKPRQQRRTHLQSLGARKAQRDRQVAAMTNTPGATRQSSRK